MHTEFKELALKDGRTIPVDKRIYPMLMEWDWHYDHLTAQAVRHEGDRVLPLYAEQIKHLRNDDSLPMLPRPAVRAQFGHLPAYRKLLLLSMRQREFALWQLNAMLPVVHEVTAEALACGLAAYFRWQVGGIRYVADSTLPGPMATEPIGQTEYSTLGDFLVGEWTGQWERDPNAPVGVTPQNVRNWLSETVHGRWRAMYRAYNYGSGTKVRTVERILKTQDMPVWLLIQHVMSVIDEYPV